MIYFDEHNRLHIVDNDGWWEPNRIPSLLSEIYSALANGAEDGISFHETAMFLQLLLPTKEQMKDMFAPHRTTNETDKEDAQ